jgi:transcriptional regulator with XRE-family HTH domain
MVGNPDSSIAKAFGLVLRRQRKARGLSQEALALEAGVQRNYVSLIELGRNQPTISVVFKLARALSIKPAKLIQMADETLQI